VASPSNSDWIKFYWSQFCGNRFYSLESPEKFQTCISRFASYHMPFPSLSTAARLHRNAASNGRWHFVSRCLLCEVIWSHLFLCCISPQFPRFNDRGSLSVSRNCGEEEGRLQRKVTPDILYYHRNLPLFFDGLREAEEPLISEELVPYYWQILPLFIKFLLTTFNLGHKTEWVQWKRFNLSDLIHATFLKWRRPADPRPLSTTNIWFQPASRLIQAESKPILKCFLFLKKSFKKY
jgi:hypothetical protein